MSSSNSTSKPSFTSELRPDSYPMSLMVAFAVGYVVGARGGGEDLDQIIQSLKAILESDEFAVLVKSLRIHLGHTLGELADLVERAGPAGSTGQDLVDRVRHLVKQG